MKSKPNLNITVKGAKLLQDLDEQKGKGKQDPQVSIQLGAQKFKTKTATNQGKVPIWNETFQFVYDPKNSSLKVNVYDVDPQKKNSEEIIGEGVLNLQNAETAPEWLVQVPLYKDQNDMGSLELEFDFIGKKKPAAKKDKSELGSERQLDKSNNNSMSSKQELKQQQDNNYDFQTVNIEAQQAELNKWIQQIKDREYINTLKYLEDSRLQAAIERALNQVAEQNPKDQIDYFADLIMTSISYNAKKLRPFKIQRDALINDLNKLSLEYQEEEKLNDVYFDEIGKAEKEYDALQKQLEQHQKLHQDKTSGPVTQESQGIDAKLEYEVIKTLKLFLLNISKKETLEVIQEKEIAKRLQRNQNFQLTLNPKQDEENAKVEEDELDNGYYITLRNQCNSVQVKVPGTIKTFRELKQIVKSCFMAEDNEIFYTDQMGNLLQFEMNVLNELYPPIYELLRNYEPTVGVQLIKQKKQKEDRNNVSQFDEVLFTEAYPEGLTKVFRQTRRLENKMDWSLYLGYLNKVKYFFESCLFIILLFLFIYTEINQIKFVTNTQILASFQNSYPIQRSYPIPVFNLSSLIYQTLAGENDIHYFYNYPLKSGLLIQKLVQEENIDDCHILNTKQKSMFSTKNQSCLNFDELFVEDLDGDYTQTDFNPSKYDNYYGGYVWELNLTDQNSFQNSIEQIKSQKWLKYNIKQSQFILNYFNSPTQRLIQATITTLYLFNDELLNYNTMQTQAFDLNSSTDQEVLAHSIMFYIAILLLVPSFFDFFGFYFIGTQNTLILIYLQYMELLNRRRKMQSKKRDLAPQEEREFQQKKLIVSDFFIFNLKVLYVVIKIPLIFDIIYMLSNVSILIRSTISKSYQDELSLIDVGSNSYQDVSKLITPLYTTRIYDGIQMLFLMIAINRFLGNWSPYLKCYGLVIIRFNKESWFLLLVLIFIISICAMSWSITIQGKLVNHDNFFYSFIGLLRCTLKYGMHNDIAEQGFYNNYVKDISYSFDTRYIQYVIVMVLTMIMVPIFISLMTQQVHNTKEEAKQKMMDYKK
ncbi:unnamed protein product [Paramecium pentaurelia]|uniref:C2 domain-containing protein n=1 Tax=Paramecium pentaurelia TaxID=43138 RepID=A0A8S1UB67_9CILI|nr:unnamed protein product [Paramecium pentaurelia]